MQMRGQGRHLSVQPPSYPCVRISGSRRTDDRSNLEFLVDLEADCALLNHQPTVSSGAERTSLPSLPGGSGSCTRTGIETQGDYSGLACVGYHATDRLLRDYRDVSPDWSPPRTLSSGCYIWRPYNRVVVNSGTVGPHWPATLSGGSRALYGAERVSGA